MNPAEILKRIKATARIDEALDVMFDWFDDTALAQRWDDWDQALDLAQTHEDWSQALLVGFLTITHADRKRDSRRRFLVFANAHLRPELRRALSE